MTIRKTLLRAFLLIGLTPAILIAVLAVLRARAAILDTIEQGLQQQATVLAAEIDKSMFERLQNGATWSSLEVMQDIQVQDIDKRLSNFLAKLQSGYGGVYRELSVVDRHNIVLASSAPAALGQARPPGPIWQALTLAGASLRIEPPLRSGQAPSLTIRAPIQDPYHPGLAGYLLLVLDWRQIDQRLEHASGGRPIVLLDRSGVALAGSLAAGATPVLADWTLAQRQSGVFRHPGAPMAAGDMVAALARAPDKGDVSGLQWSVLVLQPQDQALAPLRKLAVLALSILLALLLMLLLAATRISAAIAGPLQELTSFTRRYKLGQSDHLIAPVANGEVGELGAAFQQMMGQIEQARRDLVRTSKLAVVGEMASAILHEVRTPLGIMRSSAQMLQREPGLSAEGREMSGFIESETVRLNQLMSSMLDSARARPPYPVPTDLHALMHQARALLGAQIEQHGVSVAEHFNASDPMLECDGGQITQVLLNLIVNALQVLPAGGAIELASADAGDAVRLDVSDNGPGIAPEERTRVFDAFYSRRAGGFGLGLAIVQQLVAAHGGQIEAGASPSGGACFTITLPRTARKTGENTP